jgi:hypothetical protein
MWLQHYTWFLNVSLSPSPQELNTHAVYTVCLIVNKYLRQYLWKLLLVNYETLFIRPLADYCNKWQAVLCYDVIYYSLIRLKKCWCCLWKFALRREHSERSTATERMRRSVGGDTKWRMGQGEPASRPGLGSDIPT